MPKVVRNPLSRPRDVFEACREYYGIPHDAPLVLESSYIAPFLAGAAWAASQRLTPAELRELADILEKGARHD